MKTADKQRILDHYETADESGKKLLESIHGEKYFRKSNSGKIKGYTDIECVPDALEGLGFDRNAGIPLVKLLEEQIPLLNDKSVLDKADVESIIAYAELIVMNRAVNKDYETSEEYVPNWDNENERKYFPFFDMRSGFGFSYTVCDYWYSYTLAGSRLCSKDEERAKYSGTKFLETHKKFITQ